MMAKQSQPQFLKPGYKIGVIAPSSYVERDDIEKSSTRLKALGFDVFVHPQTFERDGQSAGNVLQKSLALQGLWQREDIDAIWFAGGGNHSLDLIKHLNFETLKKRPAKPILGFSDNTTLLNTIPYHTGCTAFHAPVFKQIHSYSEKQLKTCLNILTGQTRALSFSNDQILKRNNKDIISGKIFGGNLSLFQYMVPLMPENHFNNSIIFIEECNEELSKIDRCLSFLENLGFFEKISAILFGEFSGICDTGRPFGKTLNDAINYHIPDNKINVIKNLAIGHATPYNPIIFNHNSEINIKTRTVSW